MSADIQLPPPAPAPANDFWKRKTIEELVAGLDVKAYDPSAWKGVPDMTIEELDSWLAELRRLRNEGK